MWTFISLLKPPSWAAAAGAALALACVPSSIAGANDPVRVIQVSAQADGVGRTRLVVETDRPVRGVRSFLLSGPDRLVVDVPGAHWARAGEAPGGGLALRYRYANRAEGAARIVFDLAGQAAIAGRRTELAGRRLTFILSGEAAPTQVTPLVAAPPTDERMRLGAPVRRPTVVIDAGHGGRDPGAIGVGAVREEDVTLAAALRLRDALRARGYTVALTREGDEFLALDARVAVARARNADLFISLHADSAPGTDAHGAAVYMLSERGANRSRVLADRQDWQVDVGDEAPREGGVRQILFDLTQRETTNRSSDFARGLIRRLEESGAPIRYRRPRNAGFYVLLAPDVPAVLVEMGFLTHAGDAARLTDPAAQTRFTGALADAVDSYFASALQMASR